MIAVFASGQGSNFEALAKAFPGAVGALLTNVEHAGVLERARRLGVPARSVPHTAYTTRMAHEEAMLQSLAFLLPPHTPLRLLVLAGYMRILSESFLAAFAHTFPRARAWNLHPAHLDEYRGPSAFEFAVAHRFPRWGLSVHEVTPELDGGTLVASCEVPVWPTDSPQTLHARARESEHALLVRAVQDHLCSPC